MNSKLTVLTVIAALALSPTLAACGGGEDQPKSAPSASGSTSESEAPPSTGASETPPSISASTPASTPGTTATATPPPALPSATPPPAKPTPAKPAPTAANGTNYKSCSDGRCEVAVRTGTRLPVKASLLGFTNVLVINRVSDGSVAYGAKGGCCSISTSAQKPGGSYILNNLKVTTVAVAGKTAILRLSPA
ncbi:hypothetical protein AB0P21_34740 [Kribbella sp. NPDC056861]|uniref:hypothetical protein n=1 Tax=Kribbella sp. NPDC056861 TaxID=3154857 RepID=UPI003439FEC8